ncbi:MAG: polysaccharide deacetylase family protein [Gemmatimonadales bacterium]
MSIRAARFMAAGLGLLLTGAGAIPERRVLLTFDDIPASYSAAPGLHCDSQALRDLDGRLLEALESAGAPSVGFVTTNNICDRLRDSVLTGIIGRWRQAGAEIGNHGHGHLDINRVSLETYLADLGRADRFLRGVPPGEVGYFRHPFLHTGPDRARADGLRDWLAQHGYRTVPVTIDNQEWVYARAYSLARQRGDSALLQRLVPAYLDHLDRSFAFAESVSVAVIGREVPQILLLHANELNADQMAHVLDRIHRRGYRFAGVKEVLADPVYRRASNYLGPRGLSWLLRWSPDPDDWRREGPREPAWVAEAAGG